MTRRSEQVDIVYLWVDGADPAWQSKRQRAYASWIKLHPDKLAVYGNVAGRFRDNGELRFNLRALETFFPEHGHIYIVTDGQVPSWLRPSNRLTVVDHRELIPAAARPVFDSGHISTYIHRIPGLSEKFFYLNDDVFFGASVDCAWWFGERLTVLTEAATVPDYDTLQPHESALVNASILSRNWMTQRYPEYRHDPRIFSHAPRPMLKSVMYALERLAPELFRQVRSTTFRSWRGPPIVGDFVPRWMIHAGYARPMTSDALYICTGDQTAVNQFETLNAKFGTLPFFCINDTCDDAPDHDPRLLKITQTLENLLPEPSSFERCFVPTYSAPIRSESAQRTSALA